ncbi:hypothetical protein RFI_12018 [Reticulomyxa filosa]|uniref:Uncharacterized protein n=1 Tax=Reticulomyxa filosa TaxID=46433 RepID=X6NGJ8_RETFI|nr:hypothetical protein RFI_12018 [Reticulomyxa filosa]|eukprot:ETO25121.1 hypothetical protein RFI_12018 [Reticulomyxa filosa]
MVQTNDEIGLSNLSEAQIQSQISQMNLDFRALNSDLSKTPEYFVSRIGDFGLYFYLHQIVRKSINFLCDYSSSPNRVKFDDQGGSDAWDSRYFLNIWLCQITNNIIGYCRRELLYCFQYIFLFVCVVIMDKGYFGSINFQSRNETFYFANSKHQYGRTTTHEGCSFSKRKHVFGHWLNLRHIWGQDGCQYDDGIADTPQQVCPFYNFLRFCYIARYSDMNNGQL